MTQLRLRHLLIACLTVGILVSFRTSIFSTTSIQFQLLESAHEEDGHGSSSAHSHISNSSTLPTTTDADGADGDDTALTLHNEATKSSSITIDTIDMSMIEAQAQWREDRLSHYPTWFENGNGTGDLLPDADKDGPGPILDFLIAGFAKCGTTTMMGNLAKIAPMQIGDICTPIHQTVYYAYNTFAKKYGALPGEPPKLYRGSKCPAQITDLRQISQYVPKTLIIVGIRHPVLWFQSFWNMQASKAKGHYNLMTPYNLTKPCFRRDCKMSCPQHVLFCLHRGRFHLNLARLGKTPLSDEERQLLAPSDPDGGTNVRNDHIRNPIFLYEQSELGKDYVWNDLGRQLNHPNQSLSHDVYRGAKGKENRESLSGINLINICDEENDAFRAMMMPYAYEMSVWICDYFVEADDVHVPGGNEQFCSIVRDYARDPCDRLVRVENGTYILRDDLSVLLQNGEIRADDANPVDSNEVDNENETSDENAEMDVEAYAEWRQKRLDIYPTWFANGEGTGNLLPDADKDGPILDFYIAGFAKCGTTTMMANLGQIAPMPTADICTPMHQTVYYAYNNWPKQYYNPDAGYRGSKCPAAIEGIGQLSTYLPRTLIIIGIRHPVLWFQSFWNMQVRNYRNDYAHLSPMDLTKLCPTCNHFCKDKLLFCLHRGRFHLNLAKLGKTPLTDEERQLLAPSDPDGGMKLKHDNIRNPIFFYEQSELSNDYVWSELADKLKYPGGTLTHDIYQGSKGGRFAEHGLNTLDICQEAHDEFRSMMMVYAYEMSIWICDYFVEAEDVHVAGGNEKFCSIVRDYANDPCNRLERNATDGQYMLKTEFRGQ